MNTLQNLYYNLDIEVHLYKSTKLKNHLQNIKLIQESIMNIIKENNLSIQENQLYKSYTEEELKKYLSEVNITSIRDSSVI